MDSKPSPLELEQMLKEQVPFLDETDIYFWRNIGTLPYWRLARDQTASGKCPFCAPTYQETNQVIYSNVSWWVNDNPVKKKNNGILRHLVLPHKNHVIDPIQLSPADWSHFGDALKWALTEFDIDRAGIVIRIGDAAGTIRHFHINILVPDGVKEYRAPLYKKPEDFPNEDGPRILVMEKLYQGTTFESLTPYEQGLMAGRM
jgi:diadenosine tetraphosphate (Ap4A) HIT family hydrolase